MVNKAIIVGRVGKDPEVRYSPSGSAICNFSVATTEKWKDKSTGEMVEKTEWHRIVAFNRLGEICGEYLKKGALAYIEGKIQTRSYDKNGTTVYTTEIVANEMKMLGGRGDGPQRQRNDAPAGDGQGMDDDIPF